MKNKRIEIYGDGIGCVELVEHLGGDLSVVNSARVSFGVHKEFLEEKDEKLIEYLVKHKHTSTLEHCVLTFRFKVPLFIRSQHHRHRTWSYNEISRRYTDIDIQFYEPKEYRTQHKSNRQASNIEEVSDPLVTEYYGTVNLNNLLKFVELRTHEGAQWEIQQVAKACLSIASDLYPITVSAYRDNKE